MEIKIFTDPKVKFLVGEHRMHKSEKVTHDEKTHKT